MPDDNNANETEPHSHPHIRTFRARHGRMSPTREFAISELLPRRDVLRLPSPVDLGRLHCSPRVILDFGCGMGDHTLEMLRKDPDTHVLAMDVHTAGIAAILTRSQEEELSNFSVHLGDGIDVINGHLAPGSVTEIHVLFPDPWPKARQQKRRIFQASFLQLVHPLLKADGYLRFVTDDDNYAEFVRELVLEQTLFVVSNDSWQVPMTNYHVRALKLEHTIHTFNLKRI